MSAADHWPGSALVTIAGLGRLSFWCTGDRRFYTWYVAEPKGATQSARLTVEDAPALTETLEPGHTMVSPPQAGGRQRWELSAAREPGTVAATVDVSFAIVGGICLAPRVALTRMTSSNGGP